MTVRVENLRKVSDERVREIREAFVSLGWHEAFVAPLPHGGGMEPSGKISALHYTWRKDEPPVYPDGISYTID